MSRLICEKCNKEIATKQIAWNDKNKIVLVCNGCCEKIKKANSRNPYYKDERQG